MKLLISFRGFPLNGLTTAAFGRLRLHRFYLLHQFQHHLIAILVFHWITLMPWLVWKRLLLSYLTTPQIQVLLH